MSIDGANMGVKPMRVLQSILGGKKSPSKEEQMGKDQLLAEILAAPDKYADAAVSYDGCTLWLAKQFYLILKDGFEGDTDVLFEEMKKRVGHEDYDFTGFMVGWANNAARWVLDKPEQENPAIVTLGDAS